MDDGDMNANLATYLNDYMAGAVAGIEIAKHLEESAVDAETRTELASVRAEIEADEKELSDLAIRLGIEQSSVRKAAGWLSEKAAEIKLRFDDLSGGELRTYEALEALSLGSEGKRSLWLALRSVGDGGSQVLPESEIDRLQR